MRAAIAFAAALAAGCTATSVLDVLKADHDFSFFALAVTQARFASVLNGSDPVTVFAPSNAAVLNVTRNVLDYLYNIRNNHSLLATVQFATSAGALATSSFTNGQVLPTMDGSSTHVMHVDGPAVAVDSANIVAADRKADNGFVDKVDAFLLAPQFALPPLDIMTVLRDNATAYALTTTLQAVAAASLNATFSGSRGPWAFFAPTDAAWAALPAAQRAALFANPALMESALMAMTLEARLYEVEMRSGMSVDSAEGTPLLFGRSAAGAVTVNGTAIVTPDIDAFNGVIQTTAAVVLPQFILEQM